MSTVTSPTRLSSESTSTIGSLQSSNAGNESSARRRLREFYKLQESRSNSTPTINVVSEQEDGEDEDEAVGNDKELDNDEDIDVDEYVSKLTKTNDIKHLLRQQNSLSQQLGALESKQKALVYNNYNKLISASSTLQGMIKDPEKQIDVDLDMLKSSLDHISTLTSNQGPLVTKERDQELAQSIQVKQAARWILSVEKQMATLNNTKRKSDAIALGEKAVDYIDTWTKDASHDEPEIKELLLIRERINGMLSVLQ